MDGTFGEAPKNRLFFWLYSVDKDVLRSFKKDTYLCTNFKLDVKSTNDRPSNRERMELKAWAKAMRAQLIGQLWLF